MRAENKKEEPQPGAWKRGRGLLITFVIGIQTGIIVDLVHRMIIMHGQYEDIKQEFYKTSKGATCPPAPKLIEFDASTIQHGLETCNADREIYKRQIDELKKDLFLSAHTMETENIALENAAEEAKKSTATMRRASEYIDSKREEVRTLWGYINKCHWKDGQTAECNWNAGDIHFGGRVWNPGEKTKASCGVYDEQKKSFVPGEILTPVGGGIGRCVPLEEAKNVH